MAFGIKSAEVSATGTLVADPCTVLGVYVAPGATAGSVILKDGGGSGTTLMTIDSPASSSGAANIAIPPPGMIFETDCHATISNAIGCTILYK